MPSLSYVVCRTSYVVRVHRYHALLIKKNNEQVKNINDIIEQLVQIAHPTIVIRKR